MPTAYSPAQALRAALTGLLVASAITLPAVAQDTPPDAPEPPAVAATDAPDGVSAEAQAVLDRMTDSLMALPRASVTAEVSRDEVLAYGYKLQNQESARMWLERPNRLRVEVTGDIKNRTYVYDGTQLVMYAPDQKAYATTPAPDNLGEMVSQLLDRGVEMPLIDLLYHGAGGSLAEAVLAGTRVGESSIDGKPVDHLAFRQANVDWQIWISRGERALPLKLLITTRYAVGDPQYQAVLRWDIPKRFDGKPFEFTPPAGTSKIPLNHTLFETGEEE